MTAFLLLAVVLLGGAFAYHEWCIRQLIDAVHQPQAEELDRLKEHPRRWGEDIPTKNKKG